MISQDELDFLYTTVADATDAALQGQAATGYTQLRCGFDRAERRARLQLPGAEDLLTLWASAVEKFEARFGSPNHTPETRR